MNKCLFFTTPPRPLLREGNYPYLLLNFFSYRYLFKNNNWKLAIVDCAVEHWFRKLKLNDYPKDFFKKWEEIAKILYDNFGERVWITIPDYPDDYYQGLCYENGKDNVDKTLENIKKFIKLKGCWMPVIQSNYKNIKRFEESAMLVKEIVGDYPRVAIGTVCKVRDGKFIVECCKIARKYFKNSWIHAFGLTIKYLDKVKEYINSFDSLAWTSFKKYKNSSNEKYWYFFEYIKRVENIINKT